MKIGMLWFDNDPSRSLDAKVARAVDFYRNKYGKIATLCFVHPSMLASIQEEADNENQPGDNGNGQDGIKDYSTEGVLVRCNPSVLPNHFWIGANGVKESVSP